MASIDLEKDVVKIDEHIDEKEDQLNQRHMEITNALLNFKDQIEKHEQVVHDN